MTQRMISGAELSKFKNIFKNKIVRHLPFVMLYRTSIN